MSTVTVELLCLKQDWDLRGKAFSHKKLQKVAKTSFLFLKCLDWVLVYKLLLLSFFFGNFVAPLSNNIVPGTVVHCQSTVLLQIIAFVLLQQVQWERELLQRRVDFSCCQVDPAPFQLVERTSLLKVQLALRRINNDKILQLIGYCRSLVSLALCELVWMETNSPHSLILRYLFCRFTSFLHFLIFLMPMSQLWADL